MKLKIKPSLKIKRRYLLLNADSKKKVEQAILDYIGVLGWAKASPIFVGNKNNKIILAIERGSIDEIRAAIELSKLNIKITKVSGTLKSLGR